MVAMMLLTSQWYRENSMCESRTARGFNLDYASDQKQNQRLCCCKMKVFWKLRTAQCLIHGNYSARFNNAAWQMLLSFIRHILSSSFRSYKQVLFYFTLVLLIQTTIYHL